MIFDVLTEPWMGVVDKETGEVLKVGLRDYIVNAHMYKCSAENKDFAIVRRLQQRLAEAVVIDIYGRSVNDELMSVFNNGRFDADKIDAYFDECIKNGTSFDLFDEEKPFMQVDEAKDFLLKLAEEDGCKYGGEGSWFLPYDRSDVREEVNRDGSLCGLYTYNGLLNGDITYEAALISDIS